MTRVDDTKFADSGCDKTDREGGKQTRCAVLTGAGKSAIAVVAVWGPQADACVRALFEPISDRPYRVGQVRYGVWRGLSGSRIPPENAADSQSATDPTESTGHSPGESVVITPIASSETTLVSAFEIHCHGGSAAVQRVLHDLESSGVLAVEAPPGWGMNIGKSFDPMVDDALQVLTRCATVRTAAIAMDQIRGGLWNWRGEALAKLRDDQRNVAAIAAEAAEIARHGKLGVRLNRPFDVVLAGPPNVGKSSLANAVIGFDRSITMDLAGTTRDVLDAQTVLDGWPVRIRDTAGLRRSGHSVEQQGIERAVAAISTADLIILVTQPGLPLDFNSVDESDALNQEIQSAVERLPVLKVLNKLDLAPAGGRVSEGRLLPDGWIGTVATSGQGVQQLMNAIAAAVVPGMPGTGAPVPLTSTQWRWTERLAELAEDPEAMLSALLEGPA